MPNTEWREVGDRVWVRRYDAADESVGLVEGAAGVLVIDTRWTEAAAADMRAQVTEVTTAPLVAVVNTHGHWDHVFGNAVFADVPVWAHSGCPAFMARTAEPMRERILEMDLTDQEESDLRAVRVTPPTHLAGSAQTLDLGDRSVVLRHYGWGHTDNDLVVHVPDAGVSFVGDLLKSNGPPGYRDAYPLAWPATMTAAARDCGAVVVPGHGDPVGHAFVAEWQQQLEHTAALSLAVVEARWTREEAIAEAIHPRAMEQAIERALAETRPDAVR